MSTMEAWIVLIFAVAAVLALLTRLAEIADGDAFPIPLRIASQPAAGLRALWRRAMDDHPLRLHAAAAGLGVARLFDSSSEVSVRKAARAARRCVFCSRHSSCDALLAARDWRGLEALCPNAGYLDSLKAHPRR